MPEPSRSDAPPRNPQYPQGAGYQASSAEQWDSQPPHIYGGLPRSRAENFGRTVGSAVGGVLRFPQRVGQATARLRHAGSTTRAQASAVVLDMMDTAAERAEAIGRTTGATLSDWAHTARYKTARLEDQAAERWHELRCSARERLDVAGRLAGARWNQTQRAVSQMKEEDPARFLMVVAAAAFVVGVGVRIWRSSSNE